MEPIRVLHILHCMNRAGAETMLMNYYRHMDRSKVQFDFLLTIQEKSEYEDEIYALGGRVFHVTPLGIRTMGAYYRDVKKFFQTHKEYQIIHSHTSSKSVLPLWIGKKCGIPVRVSHSHNMFVDGGFSPKEILRRLLRNSLKKVSTHNFACSRDAGVWLYGEEYWETGKVKLMPNAIDVKAYNYNSTVREEYKKKYQLQDKFVVGNVGQFRPQKNHFFVLDVFKEFLQKRSDAVLVLAGDGERKELLQQHAEELQISEQVRFLGSCSDVSSLMQMMDVFLFPSLFEGLGIVLIEAQTAGLPCLASERVIPQEVNITGLVKFYPLEKNAAEWAEQLVLLSENGSRQGQMERVRKAGYDIEEEAKKIQQFYIDSRRGEGI